MRRLVEYLTVVPEAHVRWLDTGLQWRLYDVFHGAALCRWGHLLATPVIVAGQIAMAASVRVGPVDLGWVLVVALVLLWLKVDKPVALGLGLVLVAIHLALDALHPAPGVAIAATAIAASIQAGSHVAEPIPPPWSGASRFRPIDEVLRDERAPLRLGWPLIALSGALLEAWAAPRIWPYQLLNLLSPLGYRSAEREAIWAARGPVLEDCRRLWRSEATS